MIKPIDLEYVKPNLNEHYEDWMKRIIKEINRVVNEINKEIK
jgi:hypothetical protein